MSCLVSHSLAPWQCYIVVCCTNITTYTGRQIVHENNNQQCNVTWRTNSLPQVASTGHQQCLYKQIRSYARAPLTYRIPSARQSFLQHIISLGNQFTGCTFPSLCFLAQHFQRLWIHIHQGSAGETPPGLHEIRSRDTTVGSNTIVMCPKSLCICSTYTDRTGWFWNWWCRHGRLSCGWLKTPLMRNSAWFWCRLLSSFIGSVHHGPSSSTSSSERAVGCSLLSTEGQWKLLSPGKGLNAQSTGPS